MKLLKNRHLDIIAYTFAAIIIFIPLFVVFPYRINIFLSYEGAYRLSIGQIPYRDFGLPMGFMYWAIPAIMFKIFGPFMSTLIKAQVLVNILAFFSFRSILKSFKVDGIALLIGCISFSFIYLFINFWPWYNNTVFVYELISLAFVCKAIFHENRKSKILLALLSGVFVTFSFFTKQDGGGLALLLVTTLLLIDQLYQRNFLILGSYIVGLIIPILLLFVPFLDDNILYWFNYGQPPHYSRLSLYDFLADIFYASKWEKFYLFSILSTFIFNILNQKNPFKDKRKTIYFFLTLGILVQALIVQTTSYIPHDVNIYFHCFALAYLLNILHLSKKSYNPIFVTIVVVLFFTWWSSDIWKYSKKIITRINPEIIEHKENVISKHSWFKAEDTENQKPVKWVKAPFKSFDNVMMPESTIEGIKYLKDLPALKNPEQKVVLNMSELTPLYHEIGFQPLKNGPMWYHENVVLFTNELKMICSNIENNVYDLVLFEEIPDLNNFYPEKIRECLRSNYKLDNKFLAPRELNNSTIEVYVRDE